MLTRLTPVATLFMTQHTKTPNYAREKPMYPPKVPQKLNFIECMDLDTNANCSLWIGNVMYKHSFANKQSTMKVCWNGKWQKCMHGQQVTGNNLVGKGKKEAILGAHASTNFALVCTWDRRIFQHYISRTATKVNTTDTGLHLLIPSWITTHLVWNNCSLLQSLAVCHY